MEKLRAQWEAIKESVKYNYAISDLVYETWIANLRIVDTKNNVVTISVPKEDPQIKKFLEEKYGEFFRAEIEKVLGYEVKLDFAKNKAITSKTYCEVLLEGAEKILSETEKELSQSERPFEEVELELKVFEYFVDRIRVSDDELLREEVHSYNEYRANRMEEAILSHKKLITDVKSEDGESDYIYLSKQLRMGKLQENERLLRLFADITSLLCDYEVANSKNLINSFLIRNS